MPLSSDNTYTTVLAFFKEQWNTNTPFTNAFLTGQNLLVIQALLTKRMREKTNNPSLPRVEFTDSVLGALMSMAYTYRLAHVTADTVSYANATYVENIIESMVARFYETAFWKRWCEQGIPDPNNIPYPIMAEKTDFTLTTDSYVLSNPWGQVTPTF